MKKRMSMIFGAMLLINIIAIGGIVCGNGEKTIKVYGTVELDGNPVEDADISVKNLDLGYEESTITDNDGYYEAYINGKNNDEVRVEVEFDDIDDDREFEIKDGDSNYEINFEFESTTVRKTYHKIVSLVLGWDWGVWEWVIFIFFILLILCMIKKIFFSFSHTHNDYRKRK